MRLYLCMQMLMALAIAFQSKKHGDYKLKAFPNMFYRVLGSLFRKFFFQIDVEDGVFVWWQVTEKLDVSHRSRECQNGHICHQYLQVVTNNLNSSPISDLDIFFIIDFKSKFRESTVRVYAETYSPKRTRVSISKIFLRKIKKTRQFFFYWFLLTSSTLSKEVISEDFSFISSFSSET